MKRLLFCVVRLIQTVVISVSLVVLYAAGVGLTRLFVAVAGRQRQSGSGTSGQSLWLDASPGSVDLKACERQS